MVEMAGRAGLTGWNLLLLLLVKLDLVGDKESNVCAAGAGLLLMKLDLTGDEGAGANVCAGAGRSLIC